MQILYHDENASGRETSFHLILLHSGWHVVGNGFLCLVADEEEGRRVIAELRNPQRHDTAPR